MPRSARLLALLVLLLLPLSACGRPTAPLPPAPAPTPTVVPPVQLPQDAGAHDVLMEWWYYTGHLRTPAEAREYGFEFTIFQVRRAGAPAGYLAHFAVTDVAGQTFSHQAHVVSGDPQTGFDLDVQGWRLTQPTTAGADDSIAAAMDAGPGAEQPYSLRLQLRDLKPPALHNGGYIDYGPPGGSYYYSRTRLAVSGELRSGGGGWQPVSGQAWMDHQWGNFVVAGGGWDWYSLQLNDNTELMLYVLRSANGETTGVYGTRVLADGTVRDLGPGAVVAEATGHWTSPHTRATYPSGWRLTFAAGLPPLVVTPQVADQELYFPGHADLTANVPVYWEGAVSLAGKDGSPRGQGYVELTGYGPG